MSSIFLRTEKSIRVSHYHCYASPISPFPSSLAIPPGTNVYRYINRILKSTPKSPLPSSTPRTPISTLSPPVNLTSPSSYFPPAHQKSPSLSTPAETPSRGLWGKRNAPGGTGGGKFGKEFLIAFWDVLGNEGGDSVWRSCECLFWLDLIHDIWTRWRSELIRRFPSNSGEYVFELFAQ